MLRQSNNIFGLRSRKKRRPSWYLEQFICLTFALTLSLLLFLGGGGTAENQLILIPFFSTLILLHGLSVFLKSNPKSQRNTCKIHQLPLAFLPFILWLLISANFLSIAPWRAQLDLIVYFEAWVMLWIATNHILYLRDLRIVLGLLAIAFLVHLYLGYDQFFHGKSVSELGIPKKITGLFSESTSFVFLMSLFYAVALPIVRMRYWKLAKRGAFGILLLLCFFALIFAHNFQGYLMFLIALVSGCFFTPHKRYRQIIFMLSFFVIAVLTYVALSAWVPSFGDYFFSAFRFEADSYGLSVFLASCHLFLKHALWGVGLSAFSDQLLQIKSATFPLVVEHPQSFYLLTLSELGVIGFFSLIIPLFFLFRNAWKQLEQTPKMGLVDGHRRVPTVRFYLSACGAFSVSFVLASMFHPVTKLPLFLSLFTLVLSIVGLSQRRMSLPLQKSNQMRACYMTFTLLLGGFFAYDGYRVFSSQVFLESVTERMEATLFSDEAYGDDDLDELIDMVDEALLFNRQNLDVWLLKSTLLNARYNYNPIRYEGDRLGMLEASQFALDRQKNHWRIWLRHGISLAVNGELESAEHALLRALELAPQSFDANFYMAFFSYQLIQDYDRAQMYLDKALVLQPQSREAWELSRKLNL